MTESFPVQVMARSETQEWVLDLSRPDGKWTMTLAGGDQSWTASGPNAFQALRALRADLDRAGVTIGLNGARPNAWASGMQADMGEGLVVYLCEMGTSGRSPSVRTLDGAPLDAVGSVAEQDEFDAAWLVSRTREKG